MIFPLQQMRDKQDCGNNKLLSCEKVKEEIYKSVINKFQKISIKINAWLF
jgi:hypothetical protein